MAPSLFGVLVVLLGAPVVLPFELSISIESPLRVTTHTVEMSSHGSTQGLDLGDAFLSRMHRHLRHISRASRHIFKHPMLGQSEIDRLFNGGSPFSVLHRLAHAVKDDANAPPPMALQSPPPTQGFLDILKMVKSIATPVMRGFAGVPPRGLVVIACDKSAKRLCPQQHCWRPITSCLARHAKQVEPRCLHLLQQSKLVPVPSNGSLNRERDAEEKDKQEEKLPRDAEMAAMDRVARQEAAHPSLSSLPSLGFKESLQRMHKSLLKEIREAHVALEREKRAAAHSAKPKQPHEDVGEGTPKQPQEDMNEGTPGYLTGDIEAPHGKKDMGGWSMRVYTPEQQKRLHVDEEGRPWPASKKKPDTKEVAKPKETPKAAASQAKASEKKPDTKEVAKPKERPKAAASQANPETAAPKADTTATARGAVSSTPTTSGVHLLGRYWYQKRVSQFVKTHWVLCQILLLAGVLLVSMALFWVRRASRMRALGTALDDVYRVTLTTPQQRPMPMSPLHQV